MISAPETYGLTHEGTLAHRATGGLLEGSDALWAELREAALSMPTSFRGRVDAPVNELIFRSLDEVRVIGRLSPPANATTGVLVTCHGPDVSTGATLDLAACVDRGLAVLEVWVRGVPPSTMEIDDLGNEWILHHIESAREWIVTGAVIDVVTACRAMHAHYGSEVPLLMHGAALGGGVAVMAAAQLQHLGVDLDRLILAWPDLGDWDWRISRYCNGPGQLVNMVVDARRDRAAPLRAVLGMVDAARLASAVTCPTLCMLALADDVVPAPAAAAIFNGLGSTRTWRFTTSFGHFDGGVADARRKALFSQMATVFADPAVDLDDWHGAWGPRIDMQPQIG